MKIDKICRAVVSFRENCDNVATYFAEKYIKLQVQILPILLRAKILENSILRTNLLNCAGKHRTKLCH